MFRSKFWELGIYIRKEERSPSNNLNFYLKIIEMENKLNSKQAEVRGKKKIRVEINETRNR